MPAEHPWAFKDGNTQKRIAVLELLGTLLLCKHLIAQQGIAPGRVRLPVGSDNSSNIFSLLNLSPKKPHTAALLMELALTLHREGCNLAPSHIPRNSIPGRMNSHIQTFRDSHQTAGYRIQQIFFPFL